MWDEFSYRMAENQYETPPDPPPVKHMDYGWEPLGRCAAISTLQDRLLDLKETLESYEHGTAEERRYFGESGELYGMLCKYADVLQTDYDEASDAYSEQEGLTLFRRTECQ